MMRYIAYARRGHTYQLRSAVAAVMSLILASSLHAAGETRVANCRPAFSFLSRAGQAHHKCFGATAAGVAAAVCTTRETDLK
jgi:hypothetical protein